MSATSTSFIYVFSNCERPSPFNQSFQILNHPKYLILRLVKVYFILLESQLHLEFQVKVHHRLVEWCKEVSFLFSIAL